MKIQHQLAHLYNIFGPGSYSKNVLLAFLIHTNNFYMEL